MAIPLSASEDGVIYERSLMELAKDYVDYDDFDDWEVIEENLLFEISQMKRALKVFETALGKVRKKRAANERGASQ